MNRKKKIEYNDDTENYSIEQRTTVNLTGRPSDVDVENICSWIYEIDCNNESKNSRGEMAEGGKILASVIPTLFAI